MSTLAEVQKPIDLDDIVGYLVFICMIEINGELVVIDVS